MWRYDTRFLTPTLPPTPTHKLSWFYSSHTKPLTAGGLCSCWLGCRAFIHSYVHSCGSPALHFQFIPRICIHTSCHKSNFSRILTLPLRLWLHLSSYSFFSPQSKRSSTYVYGLRDWLSRGRRTYRVHFYPYRRTRRIDCMVEQPAAWSASRDSNKVRTHAATEVDPLLPV